MTQELFIFAKSFEDRLCEFNYILNNNLKASHIKRGWSDYIELSIEPVGWRAIWKISRHLCSELKIEFPCTVVISVHHINFMDLTCAVCIDEVEDGRVRLPQIMTDVPLIELYPTIEQDTNCVLSRLFETAKIIDCLRFFYNNLWMPWDLDSDEDNSWVDSHLEGRLTLHFALMERKVPHEVAYAVRNLVTEGREIQKEIEDIEENLSEESEADGYSGRLLKLTELHNRISTLRDQYRMYEKPELLKALIQRTQSLEKSQLENENCESVVFVVLSSSTPEQLAKLAKMTSEYKVIRFFQTLQEALVKAPADASILVANGQNPVHDLGNLESGGTIRGVEPGVVLGENAESPCGWGLLKGSLTLAHLAVRMTSVWDIIKVRPGAECCLREVRLEGASITDAVDVFPGAKLVADNCNFDNCRTAVVCDTNCSVVLTNCTFTNNNVAIEVKEGCCLTLENCTISDSKLSGINIALATNDNKYALGSIESVPGLKLSGTIYKNNATNIHFIVSSSKHGENSDTEMLSASR